MEKENLILSEEQQNLVLESVKSRYGLASDRQTDIFDNFTNYYRYYRGTDDLKDAQTWKAKIHVPYIKQVVDTVLPRLISSKPKLNILPREEDDVDDAQMNEKLIDYQWDKLRMYNKIKLWVKTALIYGVGIMKIGWDFETGGKDGPWADVISNYDFYIDPRASNIKNASYVVFKQERDFMEVKKNKNYENLDKLESAISSEDNKDKVTEQSSLGRSTPGKDGRKKVVLYEYYGLMATEEGGEEEEMFIVTANNSLILRAEPLDKVYPCGKPFVALSDDPMPLDFWAIGEVEPLIPLQDELNTFRNQRIDNRKLIINNMWSVNKHAGVDWDDFVSRPGGVIEHDGTNNAVTPLFVPDTTQGSVQEEAIIKQDMDRTSGVFQGMTGQLQNPIGGGSDVNNTARGFLASIEQAGTKMQYKLDNVDDALRELGQKLLKLNQEYINKDQVVRILGRSGIKFEKIPKDAIQKEYDLKIEGGSTQPQNKEARKQDFLSLLNILVPLSQMPMEDFEPGQAPVPTKMNVKYFVDNFIDTFDLPNKEEAFISQQEIAPPTSQLGMASGQPNGQITGQIPGQNQLRNQATPATEARGL